MDIVQIMTDTIPYERTRADVVVFQVLQKQQPAAVDELDVHDTIRRILKRCWSAENERPRMQECHKILVDLSNPPNVVPKPPSTSAWTDFGVSQPSGSQDELIRRRTGRDEDLITSLLPFDYSQQLPFVPMKRSV